MLNFLVPVRVNLCFMGMYHQDNYSFYNSNKEALPILSCKGPFLNGYYPSLISEFYA